MTSAIPHIPVLTTERLSLGGFTMAHFEAFGEFVQSDRSIPLGGPSDDPRDAWESCMLHCGQWQARGYGGFWASEVATGRPVGRFSLWHPVWLDAPELSWVIYAAEDEGKGFATEGAEAVRDWAAREGLPQLYSLIAKDNTRSAALARRLGCTPDGEHRYDHGKTVDRWLHPMEGAA